MSYQSFSVNKVSLLFSFLLCGTTFATETDPASPYEDRRVPEVVPSDSPDYISNADYAIKKGDSIDPKTGEKIYDLEPLIIRSNQYREERQFKDLKKKITKNFVTNETIMKYIKEESVVSEILNCVILADLISEDFPLFGFTSKEIAEMYKKEAKLEKTLDELELFYPDDKNRSKNFKREKFELMKMKREAVDYRR